MHHPEGSKSKEQRWQDFDPKKASIQTEDPDYDGQNAESGYSKAIFDVLRDSVSLGLVGTTNHRG